MLFLSSELVALQLFFLYYSSYLFHYFLISLLYLLKGGAPNFGRFLILDKLAFMLDFSETH